MIPAPGTCPPHVQASTTSAMRGQDDEAATRTGATTTRASTCSTLPHGVRGTGSGDIGTDARDTVGAAVFGTELLCARQHAFGQTAEFAVAGLHVLLCTTRGAVGGLQADMGFLASCASGMRLR
jgi:hypothetical protein